MAVSRRSVAAWNGLSAAQRKRYIGAARTGTLTGQKITGTPKQVEAAARKYYVSGGNLGAARGHKEVPRPPLRLRAPSDATKAASKGKATNAQLKELERWQRDSAPKWLRDSRLSEDTAAILSNVNLQPQNWRSIDVYRQPDGSVVIYIKSKKGGPDRKVTLPDDTSLREVLSLIETPGRRGGGAGGGETFVRTFGYERAPGNTTQKANIRRVGNALPRQRRK